MSEFRKIIEKNLNKYNYSLNEGYYDHEGVTFDELYDYMQQIAPELTYESSKKVYPSSSFASDTWMYKYISQWDKYIPISNDRISIADKVNIRNELNNKFGEDNIIVKEIDMDYYNNDCAALLLGYVFPKDLKDGK